MFSSLLVVLNNFHIDFEMNGRPQIQSSKPKLARAKSNHEATKLEIGPYRCGLPQTLQQRPCSGTEEWQKDYPPKIEIKKTNIRGRVKRGGGPFWARCHPKCSNTEKQKKGKITE